MRSFYKNDVQFKLPSGVNQLFCALRIAFAGQLDDDFVISLAVRGHERFRQAESVNTAPDRLLGLIHGPLLNVRNVRRFHRQEIAGGFAGGRSNIPIRKLVGNKIAGGSSLRWGNVVHQNLRVAQLAKLVIADGLVAKLLGDIVEGLISFLADRLLYLYLQDKMRSSLQVQTELDAVGKIRFQSGQRLWRIGNSNQTDNTNKNDGCDENCLPLEIRIHGLDWLRTPLVRAVGAVAKARQLAEPASATFRPPD